MHIRPAQEGDRLAVLGIVAP
ncbi:MAG: hypothetical protein JWR39_1050, partial [Devosia sp.]|nr:hypothetical protein [Devosia sp.]